MSVVNPFGYNYNTAAFLHNSPQDKIWKWAKKKIPPVFKPWEAKSFKSYIDEVGHFAMESAFDQAVKQTIGGEFAVPLAIAEAAGFDPTAPIKDPGISMVQKEQEQMFGMPPADTTGKGVSLPDRYKHATDFLHPETAEDPPKSDPDPEAAPQPDPEPTPIHDSGDTFAIM